WPFGLGWGDFHFMRRNRDGSWSGKDGWKPWIGHESPDWDPHEGYGGYQFCTFYQYDCAPPASAISLGAASHSPSRPDGARAQAAGTGIHARVLAFLGQTDPELGLSDEEAALVIDGLKVAL